MQHRLVVCVLALLVVVSSAACGSDRDALTIYSGRTQNLVGDLLERFAAEEGVPIDVKYGDSAELALLIAEEGARTPADVVLSQSPGAVAFLADRDLLAPLPDDVLGLVDERFRGDQGRWVGVTGRQRVLVYNTELVAPGELPSSVLDLADEAYRGRVALAPSNASFQDFVTAMREMAGEEATAEWLSGMAANDARTYANNNAIVEAVGRGEVPMGLVNHYYTHRFLSEDPDLPVRNHQLADDDPGALVLPSAAAIVAPSSRSEDAQRFIAFLLSDEAQRYFSDETFEYPLAAGAPANPALPPLDTVRGPVYRVEAAEGLDRTLELIRDSGLERG